MAVKQYTFRDQIKDFPWVQLAVIAAIRFAEPISFTSLFPYVYFMVKSFLHGKHEDEVGRYAGYISGMFALSQCLTGILWGRMSDKYGRKKIVLVGLIGSAFSLMMFGLSKNFWMAMAARSMAGLLNGNVGVVRTSIGEIAVKRRHQALAFSIMPLLWQVGCVIGPMVGGFLASPVEAHPHWFDPGHGGKLVHGELELFTEYPFLLPNIVVSVILLFSAAVAFLFLDETHPDRKYDYDFGRVLGRGITRILFVGRGSPSSVETPDYKSAFEESQLHISDEEAQQTPLLGPRSETPGAHSASAHADLPEVDQRWSAILVPGIRKLLMCMFFMSLHTVVFEELLPIYLSTDVKFGLPGQRGPFPGGLGFEASDVGVVLSVCGVMGIVLMVFVYPNVDRLYGTVGPFKIMIKGQPFVYFGMPFLLYLLNFSRSTMFLLINAYMILRTVFNSMSYPGLLLLINRSVDDKRHLGVVNGCTQVVSAMARAMGPIVWGYFMTSGQALGHGELPWWLLSLVAIAGAAYSSTIEDKEEDDDDEE